MMQNQIVEMMQATKNRQEKSILRVLVAEFQREESKVLSDELVCSIIRKMIKNSNTVLGRARNEEEKFEAAFNIQFLSALLPSQNTEISESVIIDWVKNNLDLEGAANKLSLMRPLKEQFPSVDGNKLKSILQNI